MPETTTVTIGVHISRAVLRGARLIIILQYEKDFDHVCEHFGIEPLNTACSFRLSQLPVPIEEFLADELGFTAEAIKDILEGETRHVAISWDSYYVIFESELVRRKIAEEYGE